MVVGCRFWGDPSRCGMENTTHLNLVLSTGETIRTSRQTRTFGSARVSRMNPGGETTQVWLAVTSRTRILSNWAERPALVLFLTTCTRFLLQATLLVCAVEWLQKVEEWSKAA